VVLEHTQLGKQVLQVTLVLLVQQELQEQVLREQQDLQVLLEQPEPRLQLWGRLVLQVRKDQLVLLELQDKYLITLVNITTASLTP
jgi:hypothetical protein